MKVPRVVQRDANGNTIDHGNRIQRIPGRGYRINGKSLAHDFDPFRPNRFDTRTRSAPYGVSDGKGGRLPRS